MKEFNENQLDLGVEQEFHDYQEAVIDHQISETMTDHRALLDKPIDDTPIDQTITLEDGSDIEKVNEQSHSTMESLGAPSTSDEVVIEDEKIDDGQNVPPFQEHYYASLTRRICAFVIDLIMILAIGWMINLSAIGRPLIKYLLVVGIDCGYFAGLTYFFKGQTIGKMILRIRTVTIEGEYVSLKEVFYREIVMRSIHRVFGFLYLFIIFSKNRQQLGDLIAETCVVKEAR